MNSYYKTINEHGQVVLNLPTSKIGYCYPGALVLYTKE